MIYVYDLLINLNNELFDFYDWSNNDILTHIRRVPLFKVDDKTYIDILSNNIIVSSEILDLINNKTEVYNKRIEYIKYAVLFTNGINGFVITFDESGSSKHISKLLIGEEIEICNIARKLKDYLVGYIIKSKRKVNNRLLRSEKEKINIILKELEKNKNDKEKIKYLSIEWFNNERSYDELINDIKKDYSYKHEEFMNLLCIK